MLDCPIDEIDAAAMRLLVLRHAKSEKAEAGMPDRGRRLNARGLRDAAAVGAYIVRHGLAPDAALVSAAQRTREAWEQVAAELAVPPSPAYEERLYNSGGGAILKLIRQAGGAAPNRRSDIGDGVDVGARR